VAEQTELERDLRLLETNLRTLEQEYNRFFAGQLPRPPVEIRARVERLLRRYDRAYIQSNSDRFRLNTLQSRFSSFAELWDRAIRAREEGRPGPFFRPRREEPAQEPPPEATTAPAASTPEDAQTAPPGDRLLCTTTLSDPTAERAKVLALYESLLEARRATGNEEALPFHRFAQMVATQVARLNDAGTRDVSFRVSVKDNKVTFTARGSKGGTGEGGK
jgi:hypothetical protein